MVRDLLRQFNFNPEVTQTTLFGNGLINRTWLVSAKNKTYILQRINDNVFTNPQAIDDNINAINRFLKTHSPGYIFTAPVFSKNNKSLIRIDGEGYFRMFEFIEGSKTYTVLENPLLACEAAKQFGRFTKLLSGFNINDLKITLPAFHDLKLRYLQFIQAANYHNNERVKQSKETIAVLESYKYIVDIFDSIQQNPAFKKRVTHHDTKISNVLFDENNKGICVIDLDTVMPGYFISDVGDMMRTYLSPAGEEEKDYTKLDIREDYFDAIVKGYLGEMQYELSNEEKQYFVYAGKFMIYMQALRFITDYLNNDIYYGAKYELHNLHRATNQLTLLNIITSKETELTKRVEAFIKQDITQKAG
ncbi:MAG TPA: aminoglycoside phosphotransferase family protein [Panacibacter sp.]|nr:aminoglycoside phosphotransferase family protein [Panacibacter sp.]